MAARHHVKHLAGAINRSRSVPAGPVDKGYRPAVYRRATGDYQQAARDWIAHHPDAMSRGAIPAWVRAEQAKGLDFGGSAGDNLGAPVTPVSSLQALLGGFNHQAHQGTPPLVGQPGGPFGQLGGGPTPIPPSPTPEPPSLGGTLPFLHPAGQAHPGVPNPLLAQLGAGVPHGFGPGGAVSPGAPPPGPPHQPGQLAPGADAGARGSALFEQLTGRPDGSNPLIPQPQNHSPAQPLIPGGHFQNPQPGLHPFGALGGQVGFQPPQPQVAAARAALGYA